MHHEDRLDERKRWVWDGLGCVHYPLQVLRQLLNQAEIHPVNILFIVHPETLKQILVHMLNLFGRLRCAFTITTSVWWDQGADCGDRDAKKPESVDHLHHSHIDEDRMVFRWRAHIYVNIQPKFISEIITQFNHFNHTMQVYLINKL